MIAVLCAAALATPAALCGQTPDPPEQQKQEAKREIDEGASAYRARDYYEAQLHFERATQLDPTQKNAPLFVARAIHARYKPGDDSPENVATARAAISAYERVLEKDPAVDDANNAIVYLYRLIKDEDGERRWLAARAGDEQVPAEKRALSYTVLASKDWQCSYNVTEQPENKRAVERRNRVVVEYVMPKDRSDFARAEQCARRGLELSEKAVALDPQSDQAWSFRANLFLELAKLAEMESDSAGALAFQKQADEAQHRVTELNEQRKKKGLEEKAEGAPRPPR